MKIVIIGAGGHGRVVLDILREAKTQEVYGFLDANPDLRGTIVDGIEVLGDMSQINIQNWWLEGAIVAIGDNTVRNEYADKLTEAGVELANAIHPYSCIAQTAKIGKNVVICAGVTVCSHAAIGDSVILNTGCIVEHGSRICRESHIGPGATLAGNVTVEQGAFVGGGATVLPNITIRRNATVGAGAVVTHDVPANTTVAGVPAKDIKE